MLMLNNSVVFLPESIKPPAVTDDVANFDLGYILSSDEDQPVDYSVTRKCLCAEKKTKPARVYKKPQSEDVMKDLSQKHFAAETDKKLRWVLHTYNEWSEQRNCNHDQVPITCDLDKFVCIEKHTLCHALCRFVCEICKINGEDYPLKTIYEIIIYVQMLLESHGVFWKFFEDPEFSDLKYTVDNIMKERAMSGLGSYIKQATVLSFEQEEFLWQNRYLGISNPEQLVKILLFLLGIHYALCVGAEHCALHSIGHNSQFCFIFKEGIHHILYTEDLGTKNNSGGLRHKKIQTKTVTIFPGPNRDRCPVRIFTLYHCKLPLKRKCTALYLHPKKSNWQDGVWYKVRALGINQL